MQAHGAIEIFELHMRKRTDLDGAGVVNQKVDLTKVLKHLLNCGLNLRGLEQVARNCQNVCGQTIQLRFGARELFGIARDKSDLSSSCADLALNSQSERARV